MKKKALTPPIRFPASLDAVDEKLLPVALQAFLSEGYGSSSFSELAGRSGLSRQRVNYHYKSLDQVLLRLVQLWAESGRQATIEFLARAILPTPESKILGMLEAVFEWNRLYPELARLTPLISQMSAAISEVSLVYAATMEGGRARVRGFLQEVPSLKKASAKELEDLTQCCHLIMAGGGHYALSLGGWHQSDQAAQAARRVLRELLAQIRERGSEVLKDA